VRQQARGWCDGRLVITLEFRAAIGLIDPHDRVIVQGEPPIDIVWKGGVQGDIATSAVVLNCIGPLRAAAPGLHTMATIPLVGFASGRKAVEAGV
jgi:4-hydroxy-tetrahydrodipicolinate reductase